jgi:hypothetical protein
MGDMVEKVLIVPLGVYVYLNKSKGDIAMEGAVSGY